MEFMLSAECNVMVMVWWRVAPKKKERGGVVVTSWWWMVDRGWETSVG